MDASSSMVRPATTTDDPLGLPFVCRGQRQKLPQADAAPPCPDWHAAKIPFRQKRTYLNCLLPITPISGGAGLNQHWARSGASKFHHTRAPQWANLYSVALLTR